jgi:predicted nucleic acid-binding protein
LIPIIVDTNILFSALLGKNNLLRDRLLNPKETLYSCKFIMVELFKYKEKISRYSNLSEEAILELLYNLLKNINFIDEHTLTQECLKQAHSLCHDIDEKDTPFVALTMELNGVLWTYDKKLKQGLARKGFTRFLENDNN